MIATNKYPVGIESTEKRLTCSDEIIDLLKSMAERVEHAADRVSNKLNSVCIDSQPLAHGNAECVPRKQSPPLFAQIRELIEVTELSVDRINDVLNRCEL